VAIGCVAKEPVAPVDREGAEVAPVTTSWTPPVEVLRPDPHDLFDDGWPRDGTTIVYVTEQKTPDGAEPAAIVFSSDSSNPWAQRRSSARVTVHPRRRADMNALLADLGALGFERLPWVKQRHDALIGSERALYRFRGGQRWSVVKAALGGDDLVAFSAVERELIAASLRGLR
jgi:hypothetical protein